MTDGAHLGINASRALETVLGGEEPPSEEEQMTVEQFRDWILGAQWPIPTDPNSNDDAYGECARYTAKLVLTWINEDPERRANMPIDTEYDWSADPDRGANGRKPEYLIAIGVYDAMKADGIDLGELQLTGFMWGWACNAARRCLELPPVPNPAIVIIDIGGTQ